MSQSLSQILFASKSKGENDEEMVDVYHDKDVVVGKGKTSEYHGLWD